MDSDDQPRLAHRAGRNNYSQASCLLWAAATVLAISTLYWTVFGFALGLLQWVLIRTPIPRAFGWVIFTTMGGFLSAMLLVALSSQDLTKNLLLAYPFLAYLIAGTTLGVAQYQIMKATFSQARWWILAVAFGWALASELVNIPNALIRLCGVLLFGTLTGIVFSWLSKGTIPEAQAAQHSVHLTGGYAPRFQMFSWLKPIPLKWRYLVPPASK